MIYITGDTHIPVDIKKLSTRCFPQQKEMTKDDFVIICGDFGGVWDGSNEEKYWIKWLKRKNFTTLFVDGNHENFESLSKLPVIKFGDSVVGKVDDGIYHLLRGEVYSIDGKRFFVFGGGSSHDREYRTEGKNWWEEELPTFDEYRNAEKNMTICNYEFDYIITHSAPNSIQNSIAPSYENNELTVFLEKVKSKARYTKWFFGHYHQDENIDDKHIAVFNSIHKI